jgi:hypothetical protein
MTASRATPWAIVLAAVLLAGADLFFFSGRERSADPSEEGIIEVREASDFGPGSLRDALLQAAGRDSRAEIVIRTPRLAIRNPLPPLVNPHGTILRCEGQSCSIDAAQVGGTALLDVLAPQSRIESLEIVGSPSAAVLVRAPNVSLQRLRFVGNEVGVAIVETASGVQIYESSFVENAVGVRIEGATTRIVLRGNLFRGHRTAGLWAVAPAQAPGFGGDSIVAVQNRFQNDEIAALVINMPSRVEGNEISGARGTGLYVGGSRNSILDNRLLDGRSTGLVADTAWSTTFSGNEVGRNASIGLLLHGGGSNDVRGNRVYANGFGIVMVSESRLSPTVLRNNLLFGQKHDAVWLFDVAPIARDNRVVNNSGAGIRLVETASRRGGEDFPDSLVNLNQLELNGVPVAIEVDERSEP